MHPYSQQPDQSFWRRFVSDTAWSDVDFVGTPKFTLRPEDKISMAGSCFAQHIARHMRKRGLTPFQTELAHPLSREADIQDTSYDMFSARFGNVYTSRQCLELLQQAVGQRPIIEDFVTQDGRVYDLLRPNAIPGGFAALEEAQADRQFHMARVRAMFEGADVLVYTLGLTESWYHRYGAYTYPVCPGTARGVFDPQLHQFHNLTQAQVVADLVALVELAGQINPGLKFIFTVSPVPLVATYTKQNVLLASSYSKAVLRAACGEVAERYAKVMYFPSYEIISHPASFGQYLQGDLREVTERGVSHVMRCFFAAMYDGDQDSVQLQSSAAETLSVQVHGGNMVPAAPDIAALLSAECEEMFNDLNRGKGP